MQVPVEQKIGEGVVIRVGPRYALVLPNRGELAGRSQGFKVSIRPEEHQTMKICAKQKHGIAFTGNVTPAEPQIGDRVYVQIASADAPEATAWAQVDEKVIIDPIIVKVPTRHPNPPPNAYAIRAAKKKAEAQGHVLVEVQTVLMA